MESNVAVDNTEQVIELVKVEMLKRLETAGDILKDAMRAEAPIGETSALKRSIKRTLMPTEQAVRVSAGNKKAWYVHLVLFGTIARYTYHRSKTHRIGRGFAHTGKKKFVGVMPPNNFMKRAWDRTAPFLKNLFGRPITTDRFDLKYKKTMEENGLYGVHNVDFRER